MQLYIPFSYRSKDVIFLTQAGIDTDRYCARCSPSLPLSPPPHLPSCPSPSLPHPQTTKIRSCQRDSEDFCLFYHNKLMNLTYLMCFSLLQLFFLMLKLAILASESIFRLSSKCFLIGPQSSLITSLLSDMMFQAHLVFTDILKLLKNIKLDISSCPLQWRMLRLFPFKNIINNFTTNISVDIETFWSLVYALCVHFHIQMV